MDILLKVIAGVAIGVAAVGAAVVVYDIINKSNIAEKIKEVFFRKRSEMDPTENKENDIFTAIVKEKQKDSVNVDVFLGNIEDPEIENVTLVADEVADDIKEGDWISFAEDVSIFDDNEDFPLIDDDEDFGLYDDDLPYIDIA